MWCAKNGFLAVWCRVKYPQNMGGSILVSLCIVFSSNHGEKFVLADICLAEVTLHGVKSSREC